MSGSGSGSWRESGMWRVRGPGDKRNPYLNLGSSTGYSSLDGKGNISVDPSIRAIQEQNLSKSSNLYNSLGSQAEGLMGNQSDYIKARVSPLEEEFTARQGAQERNLGLRGVSGSSFGEMDRTNLATTKERELGNARSLATEESLKELAKVRAQQAQLIGMDEQTAKDRFNMELQSLGLSQQAIARITQAYEDQAKRRGGFQPYQTEHAGAVSGGGGMGGGGGGGSQAQIV